MRDCRASKLESHRKDFCLNDVKEFLSPDLVLDVISQLGISYRERIYSPFVTLLLFIGQIFHDDKSCRRSVNEFAIMRYKKGQRACSSGTSSYCKAKTRLPIPYFSLIAKRCGLFLSENSASDWKWKHGDTKVVDGTTLTMADTKANADYFGLHTNQKNAVGFPCARLLGIFSLSTGAILDLALGASKGKKTGETSLLQTKWDNFKPSDTLLGDCLFSSFRLMSQAKMRGVFLVSEFRKTSVWRINKRQNDQIIVLKKPRFIPDSLTKAEYDLLPETLVVRIIKIICAPKGFRTRVKWIITTHINANIVSGDELCDLYKMRWQVELNYRSIKTTLGMDFIPSKTPQAVEKAIWTHMITYNIIRIKMAQVALSMKVLPIDLSFRAAQQALLIARQATIFSETCVDFDPILIDLIGKNVVRTRPDRYEPRAIKKRPNRFKLLMEQRAEARKKLYKKRKK